MKKVYFHPIDAIGWIAKISLDDLKELDSLMDESGYQKYISE
jgi:glycine cleavage system H lipoate-binding protein